MDRFISQTDVNMERHIDKVSSFLRRVTKLFRSRAGVKQRVKGDFYSLWLLDSNVLGMDF